MEDFLYRVCLVFALPTMSIVALVSLITWRGKQRKVLAILSAFFLCGLILLVGGSFVLGRSGLAWRTVPLKVLMAVIMISGVIGILFLAAAILSMQFSELAPVLRVLCKLVTIACSALVLYFALTFGVVLFFFSAGETDRVVEYQGEVLVEVDRSFLDPWYVYYPYHGPLFRGNAAFHTGPEHLVPTY